MGQEPETTNPNEQAQAQEAEARADALEAQAQEAEEKQFPASYVKKLRDEAAKWRVKAQEAEKKIQAYEEEKMSERERLEKRLADIEAERLELEAKARENALKAEVATAAAKMEIDPVLAYRLLDESAVEWDEGLKPVGVEEALKSLIEQWPQLKAAPAAPVGGKGAPARGRQTRLTLEQVRAMTAEEILERWEEVQAVLKNA